MSDPNLPPCHEQAAAGFTLLELLVVIGVISVLTGLSLGFLGRTNPEQVAASILAGETRAAQMTARAEGVPTEVWVRPGRDGMPGTVQARLLQPVATFHFEPNEDVLDPSLRPVLGGEPVPHGRFGAARKNRDNERGPLLSFALGPARVALREGFVVRLDLLFDRRSAGTVLRFGPLVDLSLDDDLRPRARLRLQGATGDTTLATMAGPDPLPLHTWCTLDIACDGRSAWISWDGREIARTPAEGSMQQAADLALEVSPGEAAVPGLVDEVRLFVYSFAPQQYLPNELMPQRIYRFGFDARGEPTESPLVEYVQPERDG